MIMLTDRTTIETDWECGMKRWWYKMEGGTGMVPVDEAPYYEQGRILHHHLATLLEGTPLATVLEGVGPPPLEDLPALEVWSRLVGWLVAFHDYLLPRWRERYDVVMVEKELILDRTPLWVATTADVVLRDKEDNRLVVVDWKTVGMMGKSWIEHWPYAVQMHLNTLAVAEELGETPKYAQVVGLLKGQDRDGKLSHPYVWAYSDGEDHWQTNYYAKYPKRLVVEYPGGVEAWVRYLGEEVALAQFPHSAPIIIDPRMVAELIEDRTSRESVVAMDTERSRTNWAYRRLRFEQRFKGCRPSFGSPCPYLAACHNGEVNRDPLGSGLFVARTPHHDVERIGIEGEA